MANENKDIIFIKIKMIKEQLKHYGVVRIGLFGSYARNESTAQSDIDIIVELKKDKKNFHNFMETYNIIEKECSFIVFDDYIENELLKRATPLDRRGATTI